MTTENPKQTATQRQDTTFFICILRLICDLRILLKSVGKCHRGSCKHSLTSGMIPKFEVTRLRVKAGADPGLWSGGPAEF